MTVCLDTNAYSDWVRNIAWVSLIPTAAKVVMPAIVLGELREGFIGGRKRLENEENLRGFLESPIVVVANAGDSTSEIYADLKAYLRQKGTPIPTNDIWIAASCIENGATLLTRDKHFGFLPQVRVMWPDV